MQTSEIVALVTGGASGLGEATTRTLLAGGGRVMILDRPNSKGEELAKELGANAAFAAADVSDAAQVQAAVDATVAKFGKVNVLVNCAGVGIASRTISREGPHPLDLFKKVIEVNLVGTFNCIRLAATAMSTTEALDEFGERGAIVNTASVAAFDGQIGQASYSASKGGVVGMTLPVARDLAAVGVRVNTIAPGLIDTPIYGQGEGSEQFKERLKKDVLFPHRLGFADEFATLATELITNSYMNAETIRVDGGVRMQPK